MAMVGAVHYEAFAAFYDWTPAYAARPDVAFYVAAADDSGGPVLELGCGTGRVLLPTARAGHEVVGLDSSAAMAAECRRKLAAETEAVRDRVTLVAGDMRAFDLERAFALVTIPFRPFQHLLTVADQLACLASIRRHLAPGGTLVFDVFNPSLTALTDPARLEPFPDGEPFELPDGRRVARYARFATRDLCTQVLGVELIHEVTAADGTIRRVVDALPMRYYFRFELEHLLSRAGFAVTACYGGFDRRPFAEPYPPELIVVAQAAG
jgi:SAM-dependent methyltransferase